MEWKIEWNETKLSVWKMLERNERFQEWNERQSSILPYQFHTRFRSYKIHTDSDTVTKNMGKRLAANHLSTN